jgi:methylthioribose-1-phosphate isomerase
MLGSLMQHNDIDGVIVGADRIVKNGDTANKVSWSDCENQAS